MVKLVILSIAITPVCQICRGGLPEAGLSAGISVPEEGEEDKWVRAGMRRCWCKSRKPGKRGKRFANIFFFDIL